MNLRRKVKLRVFWARLRQWLWLPIVVLILVFLSDVVSYIKLNFSMVSRALQDPVTATLIGAVIGGVIAFWGSVYVQRAEQKARAAIWRRDEILVPLYHELLQSKDTLEERPCPRNFVLNKDVSEPCLPRFTLWPLFKTDSRRLHFPPTLADALDSFLEAIHNYASAWQTATDDPEVNRVIKEIVVTELGSRHSSRQDLVYHYLPCNHNLVKTIEGLEFDAMVRDQGGKYSRVMSNEQIASVAEKIYEECSSIPTVKELRTHRKVIDDKLEELIAALGIVIRFINERFERHERWF